MPGGVCMSSVHWDAMSSGVSLHIPFPSFDVVGAGLRRPTSDQGPFRGEKKNIFSPSPKPPDCVCPPLHTVLPVLMCLLTIVDRIGT